jgi:transmembrane sensor
VTDDSFLTGSTLSDEVVRDWLTGESLEIAQAVTAWAGGRTERLTWLARTREAYVNSAAVAPARDVARAYARLRERIVRDEGGAVGVAPAERKKKTSLFTSRTVRRGSGVGIWAGRGVMLGAAAALCALVVATLWKNAVPSFGREAQTYVSATGQRLRVTLADGSRITLAAESRLSVPGGFARTSRSVSLHGEAFFEVNASNRFPFVVRAGDVSTRVLGTAFNVRRYESDTAVHVAVVSGKVAVASGRASLTLTAGEGADATDSTAYRSQTDNRAATAWTEGRLVFYDVPVATMLTTIGRWYGYTFRVTDSTLATRRVAATFKLSERTETMNELTQLLGVVMRVDSTTITLTPRRNAQVRGAWPRRSGYTDTLIQSEAGK